MKAIEKRIANLEAKGGDVNVILIAVSPGETNEKALARSAKHTASIEGRTVCFVHTGVPRPDKD